MSDATGAASVDGLEEFSRDPGGTYQRWDSELRLAEKEFDRFRERCRKIVRRYRSEKEVAESASDAEQGLQLLWSTTQTQVPAVYQFPPEVEVSRRFKSKSPPARVAAMVLERYLQVEIDRDRFEEEVLGVLLDRLLCGMGQAWVEYEPVLGKVEQPVAVMHGEGGFVTTTGEPYNGPPPQPTPDGQMMGTQAFDAIVDCRAPAIHLDLEDFLHSPARTWREVRWVARRHFYTRDECLKQFAAGQKMFGWTPEQIPLTAKPVMADEKDEKGAPADIFKRAEVWQIWDDRAIYYIAKGMQVPLQVQRRPLVLAQSKWPCPRPFYGTMTSSSLIPVPDFVQWQDLAEEVDELTIRIRSLTRSLKLVGAYPSGMEGLEKILNDSVESELVPVDNWAAFKEAGGIEGAISWLPIERVSAVLVHLQQQRRERIDYIYQINGIGDILRGQGDPRATATQEKIKANYGSLRLQQMQQDLGRFIERVLEIKAEVICEKAPPNVLAEVSAIGEIQAEQQAIGPALAMLKNSRMRDLRIDVDEESMVAIRDEEVKRERTEFLQAVTPLVQAVMQASQQMPALLDVSGEFLGFAVRGFKAGRDLEGTIDQFVDSVREQAAQAREAAKNNPPPPPLPLLVEQTKAQNAQNLEATRHQNKMTEIQQSAQNESEKERAQAISEAAIEQFRAEAKKSIADAEAQMEARLAEMQHSFDMALERYKAELKQDADRSAQAMRDAGIMRGITATRRRKIIYNAAGDPDEMIESIEDEGEPPGVQ